MGFVLSKFRVRISDGRLPAAIVECKSANILRPKNMCRETTNLIIEGKVYGGGFGGAADADPGVGEVHDQHRGAEAAVRDQLCGLHHRRVYRGLRTLVLLLLPADGAGVLHVPGAPPPLSHCVSTATDPIESGCWLTLIFPGFSSIIFLRRLFTWYFQRKLNKNGDKLSRLKEDKRKILEQVMDKETYKVGFQIRRLFI